MRRRRPEEPAEQAFEGTVRQAALRVGSTITSYDGETATLDGRLSGTVALADLRAACELEPRGQWLRVVQGALHGLSQSAQVELDLRDVDAVRPLLRSRVYAEGALLADDVATQHLAEGLVEVLVAEVDGAVRSLPTTVVDGWGVSRGELFVQGRQQVLAAGLLTRRELDLEGVVLTALESSAPFAATHVHWLPSYVDVPAAGALVALPTRHLVLVAPMVGRTQTIDAAQALLVNADRLWRDGPGELSPDLWWWKPPELVLLPGDPTSLRPPIEFLQVLDGLPG